MKVYLVIEISPCEDCYYPDYEEVVKVFATEDAAKAYIGKMDDDGYFSYRVKPMEVIA